ncbi:MAG: hypothetical protein JWL77_6981, partial [Chthonomonadaceae bacterium]|nr:hypothetical protein [Chthonomonadaceae bacterium]
SAFAGPAIDENPGIARELIADQFAKDQPTFDNSLDGRFVNDYHPKLVNPANAAVKK